MFVTCDVPPRLYEDSDIKTTLDSLLNINVTSDNITKKSRLET